MSEEDMADLLGTLVLCILLFGNSFVEWMV